MSGRVGNNQEFKGSPVGIRQVTVLANGGTATLEAKAVDSDGNVSWVAVPDGALAVDSNYTFYAPENQSYRFAITGGAVVNVN